MDLFWSGLAQRASEYTWNERRSQFDKVFETAVRDIETQDSETLTPQFLRGYIPSDRF